MSDMRVYAAGCHCGTVRFRVATDLKPVSCCSCSV